MDDVARSGVLAEELDLPFALLADQDRAAIRVYGVEDGDNSIAWPSIYVVAQDGSIAWSDHAESYRVREAPAIILAAIDAL